MALTVFAFSAEPPAVAPEQKNAGAVYHVSVSYFRGKDTMARLPGQGLPADYVYVIREWNMVLRDEDELVLFAGDIRPNDTIIYDSGGFRNPGDPILGKNETTSGFLKAVKDRNILLKIAPRL